MNFSFGTKIVKRMDSEQGFIQDFFLGGGWVGKSLGRRGAHIAKYLFDLTHFC